MDLDETWQVGLRPEKTKPCTFPANRVMGFGESAKKWVAEALFFCDINDAPLLPLSLDQFPPNFPWTRVQVVARNTWFHIPERFPLRGWISWKTVFFGYFRVPCLCSAYGSREMFCDACTLSIPYWSSHRFILPGWLLLRDVPFSSYPPPKVILCHSISNGDTWMPIIFSNITCQVAPRDRIADLQWYILIHCTFYIIFNNIYQLRSAQTNKFHITRFCLW